MILQPNRQQRLNGNKFYCVLLIAIIPLLILSACGNAPEEDESDDSSSGNGDATATLTTPSVRITVEQAVVLALPDRDAGIIINLFQGDVRTVLSRSETDRLGDFFYEVDLGTRTGWVPAYQVEFSGDVNQLEVVTDFVSPSPTADTAIQTPTRLPEFASTPSPGFVYGRITVGRAVVLDHFSRDAAELDVLFEGELVTIGAETVPDDTGTSFYGVEYGNNQIGWILTSQVEIIEGDTTLLRPVITATPGLETPEVTETASESFPTLTPSMTVVQGPALPTAEVTLTPSPSAPPVQGPAQPTTEATDTPSPTVVVSVASSETAPSQIFPMDTSPTPTLPLEFVEEEEVPVSINLPDGWAREDVVLFGAGADGANIGLSVYEGPLPDGMSGTIWIVWGFPNIAPISGDMDLWADSIYFLRFLLFQNCNIGVDTENRQQFPIGQYQGAGTYYSAVDCGEEVSDLAGWFAALQVDGGNYAFYMGVKPVDRVLEGIPYMESILNDISFLTSENIDE